MKKVIAALPPSEFTLLENCNDSMFYGVIYDSRRHFIAQKAGKFTLINTGSLTRSDFWPWTVQETLVETIKVIADRGMEVFEFKNKKELFAWLAAE